MQSKTWLWISLIIVVVAAAGFGLWYFVYKPQAAEINCTGVAVYTEANYGGTGACFAVGEFMEEALLAKGLTADSISSMQIDDGYTAEVHSEDGYTGSTQSFTENVTDLSTVSRGGGGQTWDKIIASMKVTATPVCATVTVFDTANYTGKSACLAVGDYNIAALSTKGIDDRSISSLKISSGYTATAFNEDEFKGITTVITADTADLNDVAVVPFSGGQFTDWNDLISSIRVTATGTPTSTVSLTANGQEAATVASGASVTLAWAITNFSANLCAATPYNWFPTSPERTGTVTVNPTATTTYKLTCGTVSDEAVVTISNKPAGTVDLSASKTDIESGDTVTITWTLTGLVASTCTATPSGWFPTTAGLTGTATVTPTEDTTYTLTCSSVSDSVAINILSDTSTCATPLTETRTQSCASGQTGSITQTRTKGVAPTCAWGDWTQTATTCTTTVATTTTTTTPTTTTTATSATTTPAATGPATPLVAGGLLSLSLGAFYWIRRKI